MGRVKGYDIFGDVNFECDYTNGKKNGIQRHYTNGRMLQDKFYENDCLVYEKYFYDDGSLEREILYTDNKHEIHYSKMGENNTK